MVKKTGIKETIKRMFLFCALLRAGDKNDLCTAIKVKRVLLGSPNFFKQVPDTWCKQTYINLPTY